MFLSQEWVDNTKPTVLGVCLNKSLITITTRWTGLVMANKVYKNIDEYPS